jgi:hypothetical protein
MISLPRMGIPAVTSALSWAVSSAGVGRACVASEAAFTEGAVSTEGAVFTEKAVFTVKAVFTEKGV